MTKREYKGIELEGTDKKVSMAHSRLTERDEGMDWTAKLLDVDKAALSREQFHEVSALSSVMNFNYQVCNGGVGQYFFNGFDEYHEPMHEQDVAQLDRGEQMDMLRKLVGFGREVFPEEAGREDRLAELIRVFSANYLDGESVEESLYSYYSVRDWEDDYYTVNGFLERLFEAYAQYLCKDYSIAA